MKKLGIPVVVEPGSQPADEDGVVLDYMQMPKDVWTYAVPVIPEPEEVDGLEEGVRVLAQIRDALAAYRIGDDAIVIGLDHLDDANRMLVDQVLGDGEVSVVFEGTNGKYSNSLTRFLCRPDLSGRPQQSGHRHAPLLGQPQTCLLRSRCSTLDSECEPLCPFQ